MGAYLTGQKISVSVIAYICGSLSQQVGFLFRETVYPTVNVQKKRKPSDGLQRKNAEARFVEPTIAGIRIHQAGFRPFLFEVFE